LSQIEEVGRDVRAIKVGDRGYQNLCDHVIMPGVQRLGGWAQYVTVSAADLNCIKLPESVSSLSAAALGCRYMTAYRAVVGRGDRVIRFAEGSRGLG
jgi:NADPH:quinone reductase-like Zn-dependent oxidoreductase